MLLINFTHPLTAEQQEKLKQLLGSQATAGALQIQEQMAHFDHGAEFAAQAVALVEGVGLQPAEWQTTPLLVNLPGYAPAAACLLAELHGRMGHFPAIVRLRPLAGSTPTGYEVAEIINLQVLRDQARKRR